MPSELFKVMSNRSELINNIYEVLSNHLNTGHGKISVVVALQCEGETIAVSNVKREEAQALFKDMVHVYETGTASHLEA